MNADAASIAEAHDRDRDPGACVVLTTTPDLAGAERLAKLLVERRLVACAQIVGPIRSIYRWQGEVCDDQEVLLLLKTTRQRFDELCTVVRAEHPYDTPELVQLDATAELHYGRWLQDSVR